ncbi:MAG: hypothetical protein Q9164_005506, partial [Protoblastenia rupestris]
MVSCSSRQLKRVKELQKRVELNPTDEGHRELGELRSLLEDKKDRRKALKKNNRAKAAANPPPTSNATSAAIPPAISLPSPVLPVSTSQHPLPTTNTPTILPPTRTLTIERNRQDASEMDMSGVFGSNVNFRAFDEDGLFIGARLPGTDQGCIVHLERWTAYMFARRAWDVLDKHATWSNEGLSNERSHLCH